MAASSRRLGPHATLPLTASKYALALSWDRSGKPIDVDLQCVVVDNKGSVIDAVYYNNMKALKCLTHSGDERTGDASGYDEVVWVNLTRMPQTVAMLVFVVAAHTGGFLRDVRNGMLHVLEERKDNEVACFAMEQSAAQVDVVASLCRSGNVGWTLTVIDEPAQRGQHFMDILEPTIGNIVRKVIPGAPRRMKVAFAMEKGAVVDLPETQGLGIITAGLGWDVVGRGIDLDVSAVLFDRSARIVETVFFGNLKGSGLEHSGDNLTGAGGGDDEQIKCNLQMVPSNVQQIFFTVHVYTKGTTFQKVQNAYCRIFDDSSEMARYELREAGQESGLLIARFFREPGDQRWGFQALGSFSRGSMWKDSTRDMVNIFHQPPRALQIRGQSSMSIGGFADTTGHGRHGHHASAPFQQPLSSPECCVLQ